MTLPLLTRIGGAIIAFHSSGWPAMCEMIIWPTLQFSVSSCTTTSRPVLRTDSSIVFLSHGEMERRSISSTLAFASDLFEGFERFLHRVAPRHHGHVRARLMQLRASPNGTAGSVRSIRVRPRADVSE